jgi:hypothetical protein
MIQALVSRLDYIGMAGEAQIIIGAHIDYFFKLSAIGEFDYDIGVLGSVNITFLFEYAGVLDSLNFGLINLATFFTISHNILLKSKSLFQSLISRLEISLS